MKSTFTYSSLGSFSSNQAYWPLRSGGSQRKGYRTTERKSLPARLSKLFSKLASQLTASSDPLVWATHDATGQTVWNAKDETSGKVIRGASETEMRVWLEERYRF